MIIIWWPSSTQSFLALTLLFHITSRWSRHGVFSHEWCLICTDKAAFLAIHSWDEWRSSLCILIRGSHTVSRQHLIIIWDSQGRHRVVLREMTWWVSIHGRRWIHDELLFLCRLHVLERRIALLLRLRLLLLHTFLTGNPVEEALRGWIWSQGRGENAAVDLCRI